MIHYFSKSTYIVEGFDKVGKTTFMKNQMSDYRLYHPSHDLTDKLIGRDKSWIIGYGIVDYLCQTYNPDSPGFTVIDRGICSSYVYTRIYNNRYLENEIVDWYANNEIFRRKLGHIYVKHHDLSTAQEIYEISNSREEDSNEVSRKYDTFNSFYDYWIYYNNADQLFKEIYKKLNITPRVFETFPNMEWKEVVFK